MTMSKKPKYERSDDYRYQYIRAHPGFMGKYYLCPYCGRIMLKKTMQVDISFLSALRTSTGLIASWFRTATSIIFITSRHRVPSAITGNRIPADSGFSLLDSALSFMPLSGSCSWASLHGLPLVLPRDTFSVDSFCRISLLLGMS